MWVNYAFAFLDVAERAAQVLPEIGHVRSVRIHSTHDLARIPLGPEQMLFELVPHPWSWVITLLGPPGEDPAAALDRPGSVTLRSGDVPTELLCAHEPGLHGLRHAVVLEGEAGRVDVSGTFHEGDPWVFDPPRHQLAGGEVRILGEPEAGPGDPWYRANERAIGAVIDAVRGGAADRRLVDWSTAVRMDRAVQAGLAGKENRE